MITKEIVDLLDAQLKQKKLITWAYIKDDTNENFKYIKSKFFANESDIDRVKTLMTWSWLFESVSNTLAYYVGNPSLTFKFNTELLVKDYTTFWFACVWIYRKLWKLHTQYLPAENYYRENGVDYIIRAYQKISKTGIDKKKEYFYLVTWYSDGFIENKLYKVKSILLNDTEQVPLTTLDETFDLEELVDTWLTKSFWKIKDEDLQTPIIDKIKDKVYSVDRKIMMFDTQFLQNVESFVLMKWINLPTKIIADYNLWNKINFSDLWRYISADSDAWMEFVENTNNLIKDAMEYEQTQIEKISSITNIPMDFLGGMWTAWAIWEWSRELLHGAFIKRIINIRELFDEFITEIIDTIKQSDNTVIDQYSWDDVFSKNSKDLIDELAVALENKVISRRTSMKKYLWYSDEEVEVELWYIDAETPVVPPVVVNNLNSNNTQ